MKYVDHVHFDGLTWTILGTFLAFWVEEIIQMRRKGTTVSQIVGYLEGRSVVKHCLVALLTFVLTLHLAFFP